MFGQKSHRRRYHAGREKNKRHDDGDNNPSGTEKTFANPRVLDRTHTKMPFPALRSCFDASSLFARLCSVIKSVQGA